MVVPNARPPLRRLTTPPHKVLHPMEKFWVPLPSRYIVSGTLVGLVAVSLVVCIFTLLVSVCQRLWASTLSEGLQQGFNTNPGIKNP
jgi:hypothetical protein